MVNKYLKKDVEKFYDRCWLSSNKTNDYQVIEKVRRSSHLYAYKLLNNIKDKKLLEIGAGSGKETLYFAKKGAIVYPIDISSRSINIINKLVKKYNFKGNIIPKKMDVESIEFGDNTFDLVFINSVLMHVNHEIALKECIRVLKKNGRLIIIEPLKYNPFIMIYRIFLDYKKLRPNYIKLNEVSYFKKYFKSSRQKEFYLFSIILLIFYNFINKKLWLNLYKKFQKFDEILITKLSFLKNFCWIAVVEYTK